MPNRLTFLLLVLLFVAGRALAADNAYLERINRAGEQRMLSQRIAKSFSQLGLNVQPFVAKQELDEAVARFEANLAYLATGVDESTSASFDELRAAWQPFRAAARGVPRLNSAIWLAHQADEVQHAADRLLRDVQNSSPAASAGSGRLVALAGRQRMLSQRIVKTYLLVSWGDTSELTRDQLDAAVNEFSGALNRLRQRGEDPPDIKRELEEMAQHWEWLQAALAAEGATTYRLIVAEAAEAILQSADRLTRLYAAAR